MKIKRSSSKKQLHKWTKLGVGLAAVTVLGGLVEPGVADFGLTKVYATEQADPADKPVETAKQPEPAGATNSTDTPSVPQPTNSQPTVEERFDVLHIQYHEDETDEFMGDDFIKVYSSSPKKITPPAFEGYEFKEASVGESNTLYRKPISLPYEHRFAQVLTEQDLNNHSDFLGGRIKEALDYFRDGSGYTYILNYRRTSPVQQDPQAKRVRFEIVVKPDGAPESGALSYDSASRRFVDLHPGESYTFPVDESKFEIRPNQKLTYSYDEVEAGKDYSISVRPKAVTSQPADKPVETPAEKQVISSEVRILNVDEVAYWKGEGLDKAVVGTTTVELEVGGELTIPATAIPTGYEITDIRFNILSTGVKELPHTWTYEEYKNYTSAPMSAPAIDILVKPVSKPIETPTAPQPAETPVVTSVDKPVEIPVDSSVTKPAETPSETPAKSPAETPTNQPSTDQAEQSSTEPTVLSKQDSQAGTGSPTDQSAQGKQATKQGDKEQAPSASSSQKEEVKPAPTGQSQAKTLPATGEASSVLHLTGLGLLGLAGLVVKRRQRKSS